MRLPRRHRDTLPPGRGVNLAAIAEAGSVGVNLAALGADLSERQFQEWVVGEARANGWDVCHTFDSRTTTEDGYPDLTCKRKRDGRRELFVAELKKRGETPRPEQWEWLWTFEACGVKAYFWTPDDQDTIREVLK